MHSAISRTFFISVFTMCLAAYFDYAIGCDTSECPNYPDKQLSEPVPGFSTPVDNPIRSRAREMSINDFVTGEKSKEEKCSENNYDKQLEQKVQQLQEKDCVSENCR